MKYNRAEGNLLLQKVQNLIHISKIEQDTVKKFFVSQTVASELVFLNCLY